MAFVQRKADVLQRAMIPVKEIQPIDRDLLAETGRRRGVTHHGRADGCRGKIHGCFLEAASIRATMLSASTLNVMTRAPDQASFCQSAYGLNANWKITTGRFDIGAFRLVLQNWLLSAVNSKGAVSPLMRAIASRTPVSMPACAAR